MNGVAIVQEGNLYRIQTLQGAARGNTSIRLGMASAGEGEAYGIQVVPLNYVSAAKMAETLRPLAREGGVLYVDETRNLIILGGTQFELAGLLEAIEIFDVDWLSAMSFGLFTLEFADAGTMTDELEAILGDKSGNVAGGLVRLVPLERLNAVLAVSRQHRYIEQVRNWVQRLDKLGGGGSGNRQLYIYFVQNGKAGDLAGVLNNIFAGQARTGSAPVAGPRVAGDVAPGMQPVDIGQPEVPAPEAEPPVEAATMVSENAEPPSPARQASAQGISLSQGGQTHVVADEERNALLISGTQAEYRAVMRALKQLDRRPLEVLIEVTIADVTLSDQLQYGVRWFFESGNHSVTLSDLDDGLVTSTFPGLSYLYSVPSARAVLDLLSSITDVQVISAPQLFVLNNQEAQLQVGSQVPVASRQVTDISDPSAPIVNSIELRDVGVILKVTPRVNNNGLVIMEIQQEVSQVTQDARAGSLTPTFSKRVITTTAAVQSGQTVALGGLIQDNKTNTKVGVPGLSSIPFLGALFRYTTDSISRSELLVLVSPRVVHDERGALAITQELRSRMEDIERLEAKVVPRQAPEEQASEQETADEPAS
jgi:general secretion pathway protein D